MLALCPVLLQRMIFTEDYLSDIFIFFDEQIEASDKADASALNKLRIAMIGGKEPIRFKNTHCAVRISPQVQT